MKDSEGHTTAARNTGISSAGNWAYGVRGALPVWRYGSGSAAHSAKSRDPEAESRTVLVDAVVTGKAGEFVHDLTPKDFRIWQDGKEQAITSLSLESKSTEPHFLVLFFDDTRMAAQDQFLARQAALRFIDANSAPRRLMAVVSYNGALHVAQTSRMTLDG